METQIISQTDILSLGIELINLVETLHSLGYIHCDIKLDNIMFDDHYRLHLIDFGCAA